MRYTHPIHVLLACVLLLVGTAAQAGDGPIQVILMSGQSNMIGHGKSEFGLDPASDPDASPRQEIMGGIGSLRQMVNTNPGTFGHGGTNPLVDNNGDWLVRNDVNIYKKTDGDVRTGNHSIGFGKNTSWIGPEYGFGQIVGNAIDEDVLIIKVAWGGRSLDEDFRSPTAATRRSMSVGTTWTDMVTELNAALDAIDTNFPEYAGREREIKGFGWHQGWNDRVGGDAEGKVARYEQNMADFIADVRTEFGDDLPFMIANTGIGGPVLEGTGLTLVEAQNAMADFDKYPGHEGNVAVVDTRGMYRDGNNSPSRLGFHWNHNGIAHYELGAGLGEAYLSLVPEPNTLALLGLAGLMVTRRRKRA